MAAPLPAAASTAAAAGARRPPRMVGWLLLGPLLGWLGLFVVAPLLFLFVYSFCQRDELGQVVFDFTWDNYVRLFDPFYLGILFRSVFYAGLTTALCLLVGYPVGYYIARTPPSRRAVLLMLVMVPFWISFLLRTYAWISLLKAEGLVSALLQWTQIIGQPLEILYTPTAVVLGLVYTYLPFMILPIFTSAEKLDGALIEAALDLGARPFRAFLHVILPLTRPGVNAGILLVFVPSLGMFAVSDLMGGAKVTMVGSLIQSQFFKARDWPFGSALGVGFLLLFVVSYWFLRRGDASAR